MLNSQINVERDAKKLDEFIQFCQQIIPLMEQGKVKLNTHGVKIWKDLMKENEPSFRRIFTAAREFKLKYAHAQPGQVICLGNLDDVKVFVVRDLAGDFKLVIRNVKVQDPNTYYDLTSLTANEDPSTNSKKPWVFGNTWTPFDYFQLREAIDDSAKMTIERTTLGLADNELKLVRQLLADVKAQHYRYFKAIPGQMIKLDSVLARSWNSTLYVVKNQQGKFQIILKANSDDTYHEIILYHPLQPGTFAIKNAIWDPCDALMTRIQYLKMQVPEHIRSIPGINTEELYSTILGYEFTLKDVDFEYSCVTLSNNFKLHFRKVFGDYQILLGNPDEPFLRVDCPEKRVYKRVHFEPFTNEVIEENGEAFLERVRAAKDNLSALIEFKFDCKLEKSIKKSDLMAIYDYILSHDEIGNELEKGEEALRFPKAKTGLTRTFSIQRDDASGEIVLLLHANTKLAGHTPANPRKDPQLIIGKGGYGTVKPAFRVDTLAPRAWVNKVTKQAPNDYESTNVLNAVYESSVSQEVVKDNQAQGQHNVPLHGSVYSSQGMIKMNQPSPRRLGDLKGLIYQNKPNINLSEQDINQWIEIMLLSLQDAHRKKIKHQDIKAENIFIGVDANGKPIPFLSDYGIAENNDFPFSIKDALASYCYESPEIRIANQRAADPQNDYYFINEGYYEDPKLPNKKLKVQNWARYQLSLPENAQLLAMPNASQYHIPNPANDMWAMGIVIFELKFKHRPVGTSQADKDKINNDPLLKGLLTVKREDRFDVEKALEVHRAQQQPTPVAPAQEPAPQNALVGSGAPAGLAPQDAQVDAQLEEPQGPVPVAVVAQVEEPQNQAPAVVAQAEEPQGPAPAVVSQAVLQQAMAMTIAQAAVQLQAAAYVPHQQALTAKKVQKPMGRRNSCPMIMIKA